MTFDKLKAILSRELEVEKSIIKEKSMLVEDLGADSLDMIDIVMSIEDEFRIEVPDKTIEKFESVKDILSFIEANA